MTKTSQNINEICTRYAKALILSSQEKNQLKSVMTDFNNFRNTVKKSEDLLRFIENPLINSQKKSKVINSISKSLSYTETFQGFIKILTRHGKISLFEKVFFKFNNIIDQEEGITEILITTANPLETKTEQKIKKKLSESLNCKIKLTKIVDTEIIGGVIIKIKSIMIDNSLKSKLIDFKI